MLSTISNGVKRYPLATFFGLAYALTLVFLPIGQLPQLPMVAAIIVLAISEGKPGLKELLSQAKRWRVGWRWYLIAPAIVVAINVGGAGLNLLLGAQITPNYVPPVSGSILLEGVIVALLFGMWEEPGWTGYALPRLRAGRSLLLASLILGVLRTLWHLPLVLSGDIPWPELLLSIVAQIFFSWLYYRTDRSLLIAMLFHFTSNFFGETGFFALFEGANEIQFAWLRTGVACLIALGLIIYDRQLWFAPTSPIQSEVVSEPVAGV